MFLQGGWRGRCRCRDTRCLDVLLDALMPIVSCDVTFDAQLQLSSYAFFFFSRAAEGGALAPARHRVWWILANSPSSSCPRAAYIPATLQGTSSLMLAALNPFSGHLKSAALPAGKRINHIWCRVLHLITCPAVGLPELLLSTRDCCYRLRRDGF